MRILTLILFYEHKPMRNKFNVSFKNLTTAFESKSDKDLKKAYQLFMLMNSQTLTNVGTFFIKFALKFNFPVKYLIKNTVFAYFCGGESLIDCLPTIKALQKYHIGTILDYSVEGIKIEEGFKECMMELLAVIQKAAEDELPFAVFKPSGIGAAELMVKVQKGLPLSMYERRNFDNFKSRFETICREAYLHRVKVLVDAEESWIQNVIDDLSQEMMVKYNKESPIVYNTFQMYRKDRMAALSESYEAAKKRGYILGVKLVRGAYMKKETDYAANNMLPNPIHNTKADTDRGFNQALEYILERIDHIAICCGTHNEKSNYRMIVKMDELGIKVNHPHVFFAQLFGMSDNISYNLAKAGFNVAKYVPYGPVEAVIPYLIRRASENAAIAGQTSRELMLLKAEMKRRKLLKEQQDSLKNEAHLSADFQTNGFEFQDI